MNTNTERRKNKRLKLQRDTFAFLRCLCSNDIVAAKLVDISDRGIRIEHVGCEFSPYTQVEMNIVLPAGEACLQQLPGVTIYDREINLQNERDSQGRYCGIGFQDLTVSQQSYVKSLLGYFSKDDEGGA